MNKTAECQTPIADRARQFAPVVWLVGKVQSGKSYDRPRPRAKHRRPRSAPVFAPAPKMARVFDFPQDAPIIRFLDTRGYGEAAYDPVQDIAFCEGRSQLHPRRS